MGILVAILFSLLAVTCLGQSTNKHMICKAVDDVFDDKTSSGVARRRRIGPPGKPGLPGIAGERGFPGAKGQAGEVDYERLERIVRARVSEETRDLETKVDEMNTKIRNMTQTISAMCDGVVYNGRCFWTDIHSTLVIRITDGPEICRKKGGRLADIYGKIHYDIITSYIRTKLNEGSYILVLTGMKKIYGDRDAHLSDNTKALYTKAIDSSFQWNTAGRDRTDVYLKVRESSYTGSDQGLAAGTSGYTSHGALCQSQ